MTEYHLAATHLPTGNCEECDTIDPDLRASFQVDSLFKDFDMVYEKSVLLCIQMFPELFQEQMKRVFFGLHFEKPKTAGLEKIRLIIVLWLREDGDVEYYIDRVTKNNIFNYDERVVITDKHGVPKEMREKVDLMKRSIASIIYPPKEGE